MGLLNNSNAIESGGYNIDRSLRFRSSASAYLSRTPAVSGNRRMFTLSTWLKRGKLGVETRVVGHEQDAVTDEYFGFNSSDQIYFFGYQSGNYALNTTAVFRDPSAWYHIVMSIDTANATASNRTKIYVNGVLQSLSGSYVPQNYDFRMLAYTVATAIGTQIRNGSPASYYFDGYLAEVNFIDGQALTPSSFGQTDAVTGVWTPKKYTGTYGTNGFYLDFKDNTSATTLAYDKSGNGNNWTANNISTTAGATYDSMTDVPTLTSATAANFCVLNPLDNGSNNTLSEANLKVVGNASAWSNTRATIGMLSGKWYWETSIVSGSWGIPGISTAAAPLNTNDYPATAYGWGYRPDNGNKYTNATQTAYGAAFTVGDIIGVSFDADSGSLTFYKNGVSQGVAFTGLTSGPYFPTAAGFSSTNVINFGQRPFSYTPPTGFKALNTFNLPDPVIKKPNQYMDATTYTGNGSTQSIVNAAAFQPDLVWVKNRTTAGNNNLLVDSVRGVNGATSTLYTLFSDATSAEQSDPTNSGQAVYYGALSSLNSNGFSVKAGTGGSGQTNATSNAYVGWQWKKGATPGFDIVTYTGNGSAQNISHSLGVAPKMIIVKSRTGVQLWRVYFNGLTSGNVLYLNTTDASSPESGAFTTTAPTSSVFSVGTSAGTNSNTVPYVAYLFAEIPQFSKFGSYTGNGSTDGPFVYCGFRPKYVMVKRTDAANFWLVLDTVRNTYNVMGDGLQPNSSVAEFAWNPSKDIISNGFKVRTSDAAENTSGGTYIYAAFAENPFKYSNAR